MCCHVKAHCLLQVGGYGFTSSPCVGGTVVCCTFAYDLCTFAYDLVHYGDNTGHNRYMFLNSYILCMLKINMTAQTLLLLPVFYLDYFYTLELSAPGLVFFFSRYITTSGTFWITILIGVIGDYTGALREFRDPLDSGAYF